MERTLSCTWSVDGKRGVEPSLVQHALEELRRTIARHQSAWEDSSGVGGGAADGPASVHGGRLGGSAAAGPAAGQRSRGPASGLTLFDEAGLWRMLRKTSLRNGLNATFVNIKVRLLGGGAAEPVLCAAQNKGGSHDCAGVSCLVLWPSPSCRAAHLLAYHLPHRLLAGWQQGAAHAALAARRLARLLAATAAAGG